MSPRGKNLTTYFKFKFQLIFSREETDEKEQSDAEKLKTMKKEYERYKDQWGLNLQYSHSAGPTHNYSELDYQ